jgi:hypothetical protein
VILITPEMSAWRLGFRAPARPGVNVAMGVYQS